MNPQIYKDLSIHQSGLHTAVEQRGREGFAVVDGNEKLNKPVCAAPKS